MIAEERAVIRYASEATRAVRVTEETWHALQQCLDDGAILELVLTVAFDNMVAQVLVPLEREGESAAPETRDTWGAHGEGGEGASGATGWDHGEFPWDWPGHC